MRPKEFQTNGRNVTVDYNWSDILKRAYKPQTAQAARRYFVQNVGKGNLSEEDAHELRMHMVDTPDDEMRQTLDDLLRMAKKYEKDPSQAFFIKLLHESLSFYREEDGEIAYV